MRAVAGNVPACIVRLLEWSIVQGVLLKPRQFHEDTARVYSGFVADALKYELFRDGGKGHRC